MNWPIFLLLFSGSVFAVDLLDIPESEQNPETEEILLKKPEKYLRNESMLYNFDANLGIREQRFYSGTDRNRMSVAGHLSSDYEHFTDVLGVDFTYMHRSTRYNQMWYGFQFFQHRTYFDAITQNHTGTSTNSSADSNLRRPSNVRNMVLGGGLGVSYRFKLLLDFMETEDWFENIDVFVNYLLLNESYLREIYRGYGLTTAYGLHKRYNSNYYWGGKATYNVASVTRDEIKGESKSDRSLSLGWFTLAFEMGFFF